MILKSKLKLVKVEATKFEKIIVDTITPMPKKQKFKQYQVITYIITLNFLELLGSYSKKTE